MPATIEELKELLSQLDAKSTIDDIKTTFSKIANILLFKSFIKTDNGDYRLLEIEFYFRNNQHDDDVTITRKEKAGMWWLHDWGVDLSFESNGRDFCGGVLIRSIFSINEEKVICGPKNCCWELFYSSALERNSAPQILGKDADDFFGEIGTTKRYITGKIKGIDNEYRFFVKGLNLFFESKYIASPWKEENIAR